MNNSTSNTLARSNLNISTNGVFVPSVFSIPANSSITFGSNNPLTFVPNSNFGGNFIDIEIKHKQQGDIFCLDEYSIDLSELNQAKMMSWIKSVSPNPFTQKLRVDYKIPKDVNCTNLKT